MHMQKNETQAIAKTKADFVRKDRILIVDDDRAIRELLLKMLSSADYDVFQGKDGFEALQLLSEMSFEIVLTDIEMPGMDGWQLAEHIQRQAKDTHVILMTGLNEKRVMEKMNGSSVHAVIFKPFGLIEIREMINQTYES